MSHQQTQPTKAEWKANLSQTRSGEVSHSEVYLTTALGTDIGLVPTLPRLCTDRLELQVFEKVYRHLGLKRMTFITDPSSPLHFPLVLFPVVHCECECCHILVWLAQLMTAKACQDVIIQTLKKLILWRWTDFVPAEPILIISNQ